VKREALAEILERTYAENPRERRALDQYRRTGRINE
jgi:hypothetical protein